MKESEYITDIDESNDLIDLKEVLVKYISKWPWFLLASLLAVSLGYVYLRYAPVTYQSIAKIKIIDDSKELDIASDAFSILGGSSKINLENEIEILKSYRVLSQVVDHLKLDISYFEKGNIKTSEILDIPFTITKSIAEDSIKTPLIYNIELNGNGFLISDLKDEKTIISFENTKDVKLDLPFTIILNDLKDYRNYAGIDFEVVIHKKKNAVLQLQRDLKIEATAKKSEILSLSMIGESPERSEAILNTTIDKFNDDGVLDRQLVSKRTLDFIDERFLYLSGELDSIEVGKENYKQLNNLSYLKADAGFSLEKKSVTESEIFNLETQIELSILLQETLTNESENSLLPADIGLENSSINKLVSDYNKIALERQKLITSAGVNNPTVQVLSDQLKRGKSNVVNTVNIYQKQLQVSLKQLNQEMSRAGARFSRIPEKEKMIRSIERQQNIKENLFLLLLQKREEAAINLAVTAPSIKVVDYGLTTNKPISPKKIIIYGISLLLGLMLPFGFLYTKFALDTKIRDKAELEKINPKISILAEIPTLEDTNSFFQPNDRSARAESFRILSTNINYLLPKNNEGKVIYVTSSVKGEGKTLIALNLSLAYASIKKKVLLLGADLRNPQLHTYFDIDKNTTGLSDFLHNPEIAWEDCLNDGYTKNEYHKVCFSGPIPPNAPELLASDGLKIFLEKAKSNFDIIIVDTAPTVLVADTLLMAENADVTLFVARAGYTDKKLIEFSKGLSKDQKLKNMAYIINDVKFDKKRGYNYGYEYGYGADS